MRPSTTTTQDNLPPGTTLVDHPTARTLQDWQRVQQDYEAEGHEVGYALNPYTGRVVLWRRTEVV